MHFAVDVASRKVKTLSPAGKVQSFILAKSKSSPSEILVASNSRDLRYHDVYKANLRTAMFVVDRGLQVRIGSKESASQDKAGLVSLDVKTGQREILTQGTSADISEVLVDRKTYQHQAVAENYLKNEWRAIDPAIQADIDFLNKETKGTWDVGSRIVAWLSFL